MAEVTEVESANRGISTVNCFQDSRLTNWAHTSKLIYYTTFSTNFKSPCHLPWRIFQEAFQHIFTSQFIKSNCLFYAKLTLSSMSNFLQKIYYIIISIVPVGNLARRTILYSVFKNNKIPTAIIWINRAITKLAIDLFKRVARIIFAIFVAEKFITVFHHVVLTEIFPFHFAYNLAK